MLIVYVDDFKLAAKKGDHDEHWKAIRKVIDMDQETVDGRFLGLFARTFHYQGQECLLHPGQPPSLSPSAPIGHES